ncbi:MAG: glutathione S-transferase N-terminal domain-containing protein [Pseudomonadota bacterium]
MIDAPKPVRLATCSTAPNPRRVRAVLVEKGIEIPTQEIDLSTRAHYAPEHLEKFDTHHLPALELEDGTTLTETVAISRYLEALWPEPNLMGRMPVETAKIEQWVRRAEFQFMLPVAFVFRHSHPSMAKLETQVPAWSEANRARVLEGLALMNRRLERSPFLGRETFSLADIGAFISLDFMRVTKIEVPQEMTALMRWRAALAERPSLQRGS